MTPTVLDQPVDLIARRGAVAVGASRGVSEGRGYWFGYWFSTGVPAAMS